MATKNARIVGYLPPLYHQKLRDYMEEQSLTESADGVKIVRQFFDQGPGTKVQEAVKEKSDALIELRVDIALTPTALDGFGAGCGIGEAATISQI